MGCCLCCSIVACAHNQLGALAVRQQLPLPPFLTHYIYTLYMSKPFQPLLVLVLYVPRCRFLFPATAVILGISILLLSTVGPTGTGGHRDPNRGTLPSEAGHPSLTVDFPLYFPYFPLVTLYPFLFAVAPFSSLSFGVLYPLPFFWEWPSPRKQPRGDSVYIVARACW